MKNWFTPEKILPVMAASLAAVSCVLAVLVFRNASLERKLAAEYGQTQEAARMLQRWKKSAPAQNSTETPAAEIEQFKKLYEEAAAENSRLAKEKAAYDEQLGKLISEKNRLEEAGSSQGAFRQIMDGLTKEYADKVAEKEKQIAELSEELSAAKTADERVGGLAAELDEVKRAKEEADAKAHALAVQLDTLSQKLKTAEDAVSSNEENKRLKDKAEAQIEEFRRKAEEAQNALERLEEESREQQEELAAAKSADARNAGSLAQELEETKRSKQEAEAKAEELRQKAEEAQNNLARLEEESKKLHEELSASRQNIGAREQEAIEREKELQRLAHKAVAERERKLTARENEVFERDKELQRLAKNSSALQAKLAEMNAQNKALEEKIREKSKETAEAKKSVIELKKKIMEEEKRRQKDKGAEGSALKGKLQELQKRSAVAHYNLGVLYMNQGNYADAAQEFRLSIELNPQDALAHFNLGLINDQYIRDMGQAVTHYESYLRLLPRAPDAQEVKYRIFQLQLAQDAGVGKDLRKNKIS